MRLQEVPAAVELQNIAVGGSGILLQSSEIAADSW